jgi:broad specificity phosphatase PhoE
VKAYYLSHPQVQMERDRPVPLWRLSDVGRTRVVSVLGRPWVRDVKRIVSSAETKAVETAALIGAHLGIAVEFHHDMGENDRSSTGFLEPQAFEKAADRFFGAPDTSWNGWERAQDAADRIEASVRAALAAKPGVGPVLFVGHGAVGTLLKCRISGQTIDRRHDQPAGGGNLFAFDVAAERVLCDWTAMEHY